MTGASRLPVDPDGWAVAAIDRLRARHESLATAESLTAGLVCATVASVPGASDVLLGGVTAYTTELKTGLLAVPDDVVVRNGVVSRECVEAMAGGVRALLGSSWALATTGVAGPDLQEGRPAGTVWVAVLGPVGRPVARLLRLGGERNDVRAATVPAVLRLLVDQLD